MKSTDGNADTIWPNVGLPKHRRSARRAEMHPYFSSLLPVADIDVGRSFGTNIFLLVEGTNAEHRTGLPLTLATMADASTSGSADTSTRKAPQEQCAVLVIVPLHHQPGRDYSRAAIRAIETGSVDPPISVKPSSYIHPEHPQDEPSREHIYVM